MQTCAVTEKANQKYLKFSVEIGFREPVCVFAQASRINDDSAKAHQVRRRGEDRIKDDSRKDAKDAKLGEVEKKFSL